MLAEVAVAAVVCSRVADASSCAATAGWWQSRRPRPEGETRRPHGLLPGGQRPSQLADLILTIGGLDRVFYPRPRCWRFRPIG